MSSDRMLFLASERVGAGANLISRDIVRFGTIGRIAEIETLPDEMARVRIDGIQRGKILRLRRRNGVFEAQVYSIKHRRSKLSRAVHKEFDYAMNLFDTYMEYCDAAGLPSGSFWRCSVDPKDNLDIWCDIIAGNLGSAIARTKRQTLLETLSPQRRIKLLGSVIKEKIEELGKNPEVLNRVQAQRQKARDEADQAKRQREVEITSKLEKLKKEILEVLKLPSTRPKSAALRSVAEFPMMPIRDTVVLPLDQMPFVVGREFSVAALNQALATDKRIFLAAQHDAKADNPGSQEIYRIGTIASVEKTLNLPDNHVKVLVEAVQTGAALKISRRHGHFRAKVEFVTELERPSPETISALSDTWELVRDHHLTDADQQKLLELYHSDGPLECIRQSMDMMMAARKSRS